MFNIIIINDTPIFNTFGTMHIVRHNVSTLHNLYKSQYYIFFCGMCRIYIIVVFEVFKKYTSALLEQCQYSAWHIYKTLVENFS